MKWKISTKTQKVGGENRNGFFDVGIPRLESRQVTAVKEKNLKQKWGGGNDQKFLVLEKQCKSRFKVRKSPTNFNPVKTSVTSHWSFHTKRDSVIENDMVVYGWSGKGGSVGRKQNKNCGSRSRHCHGRPRIFFACWWLADFAPSRIS
jgi:hypothetical protein